MKKSALFLISFLLLTTASFAQTTYSEAENFFMEYSVQQDATQKRLVLMNKKGNMAKLGEETIEGLISGTLHYKTNVKGLKGVITLTYTNYSDVEGWVFNGTIITTANMSADGTLDGCIEVDGVGKVLYKNVILKDGKAGGGTYGVVLNGKEQEDVDYKLFFTACPDKK